MEDATMTTTTTINLFPSPQTRQEKYLTGPSTTTTRQQNFGNTNTT
ncbi:MAG: hypothetical protein RBR21_09880 [Bacteroidales bacterium]|nr:hypothetical protein [Bacteroidales bacterium]